MSYRREFFLVSLKPTTRRDSANSRRRWKIAAEHSRRAEGNGSGTNSKGDLFFFRKKEQRR
jgi:hypothetical protein